MQGPEKVLSGCFKVISGPEKALPGCFKVMSGCLKVISGREKVMSGQDLALFTPDKTLQPRNGNVKTATLHLSVLSGYTTKVFLICLKLNLIVGCIIIFLLCSIKYSIQLFTMKMTSNKYYFVVTNWKKQKPTSMLQVSSQVAENMEGNENFPNPAIAIANMQSISSRVQTAYNNRGNGKIARLELEAAITELDGALRTQSYYVTNTAQGDLAIIQTSGFEASKGTSSKAVVPTMPTNVKLESNNGNVSLIAKKPTGASSLCWVIYYGDVTDTVKVENGRISVPANVSAQIINAGKGREVISSLAPGTKVSVQVMAQNTAGCSSLSQLASIYVNK